MPELYTVRNAQGATLSKGQAVYVSGSQSGTLLVKLAKADSTATMPCLGLVESSFADNTLGNVVAHGQLTNFDTAAWMEGARLYVSGTVAGGLTTTKPFYPISGQLVAYVATSSVSAGVLEVVAEGSQPVLGTLLEFHAPTHYVGGIDPLTGSLDANARVEVQTSGIAVGTRRRVNFHPGSNITISASDDPVNERVNVSISGASGGGGGGGGGIAASVGGNTAGVLALISTGTMLLAGGNNVTLSQDGNSVTFSGANTVASATVVSALGVSSGGNTAGDTGLRSGTVVLQGGNNLTLSQITGGGNSATIVFSGPNTSAHSVFSGGISGGNTSGDTGTVTGRLVLAGGNNITLSGSTNAGSISVTISAFNQTAPVVSNAIQTVGSATGSGTNTSRFAADDHVHAGVFSMGVSSGGNTGGNTRVDVGRFVFEGQGLATLAQVTAAGALNTIRVSVEQTVQTQSLVQSLNASDGQISIQAGSLISISNNASTISIINLLSSATTISQVNSANVVGAMASRFALEGHQHAGVPALAAGSNTGNTAGNTGTQFGTWVIAGTDNITVSGSTGGAGVHTVWLSGGAGGGGADVSFGVSTQGNTAGTTGSVSRSILFVGGDGVTLSQSKNDGASATVTIHAAPVLSYYQNMEAATFNSTVSTQNASMFVCPLALAAPLFPGNMSPATIMFDVSGSFTATASSSSHTFTVSIGFYTLEQATRISRIFSASSTWAFAAATSNTANYHGMRFLTFHSSLFDVQPTFSQTMYWVAYWVRSSNFNPSWMWIGQKFLTNPIARSGELGTSLGSNATRKAFPFFGNSNASFTTAMPDNIGATELQYTLGAANMVPHIILNNLTKEF